jgi:hypothetical protein
MRAAVLLFLCYVSTWIFLYCNKEIGAQRRRHAMATTMP